MTHKGDNQRPYDFKKLDRGKTLYAENCRRKREEGLEPMTPEEADNYMKPRMSHGNTAAVEFAG